MQVGRAEKSLWEAERKEAVTQALISREVRATSFSTDALTLLLIPSWEIMIIGTPDCPVPK